MKTLVVYYSWSNGNTQKIAEQLRLATGADIARIETVKPKATTWTSSIKVSEK